MPIRKQPTQVPAHNVTTAPQRPRDDYDARNKHYFGSMLVRVGCFVLGVWLVRVPGWALVGWACFGLAVLIPAVAVILANATKRTRLESLGSVPPVEPPPHRQLLHRPHLHHHRSEG